MQSVHTCFFQYFCHHDRFWNFQSALHMITDIHTEDDRIILSYYAADFLYDLQRKTHSVHQRSTICIGSLIGERRQELIHKITMRAMDLHTVKPTFFHPARTLSERFDKIVDLFHSQRPRNIIHCRLFNRRRCNRMALVSIQFTLPSGMINLCADLSAGRMYAADALFPGRDLRVIPERTHDRIASRIFCHTQIFGKYQSPAALGFPDNGSPAHSVFRHHFRDGKTLRLRPDGSEVPYF